MSPRFFKISNNHVNNLKYCAFFIYFQLQKHRMTMSDKIRRERERYGTLQLNQSKVPEGSKERNHGRFYFQGGTNIDRKEKQLADKVTNGAQVKRISFTVLVQVFI